MENDRWSRVAYERLLLAQPHIEVKGLWRKDSRYFVACPSLDTAVAQNGIPLKEWFEKSCRPVTSPVELLAVIPAGAEEVKARTAEQLTMLVAEPLSQRDLFVAMHLALPTDFPNFGLSHGSGSEIVVVVAAELSPEEQAGLRSVTDRLELPAAYRVEVRSGLEFAEQEFRFRQSQGDIELRPSRRLGRSVPRALKFLVEDDDDFWSSTRTSLLAEQKHHQPKDVLPSEFSPRGASCLIDASVFPTANIRNHLTLYQTIFLVAPLGPRLDEQCKELGVTSDELLGLVDADRVRLLLPQAVDRYDMRWLGAVAEAKPRNVLLSRRLAAATVVDTRRRWPLFYPALGSDDRRAILESLARDAQSIPAGPVRGFTDSFIRTLSTAWSGAEYSLTMRGAMGTANIGIGTLAADLFETSYGRDLRIEFWSAANGVQWASALGASLFPVEVEGYSEYTASELLASLLGAPGTGCPTLVENSAHYVLDGILSVNSAIPVVQFAKEFGGADIDRVRAIVTDMVKWNQHPDSLQDAIDKFNAEVRQVEKRQDALRSLTLDRLLPAAATTTAAVMTHLDPTTSFGVLISSGALVSAARLSASRSAAIGKAIDFIDGALVGKKSDAVLVSRVKRQLKGLKK